MDSDQTAERGYEIKWLGYNDQPNHNRVCGWLEMNDGRNFTFWGTRDRKLQFKYHRNNWGDWGIKRLMEEKERKGFKKMTPEEYEVLSHGFVEDLEIWLTTAILSDTVRGETHD